MAVLDATLMSSQRERRVLGRLAASATVARCKAARISPSAERWKKLGVNACGDLDGDGAVSRTPRDHAVVRFIQHAVLMPARSWCGPRARDEASTNPIPDTRGFVRSRA